MKLTIGSIARYDKDKEGNPLKTKDNRPYTRLVIKVKEKDYEGKNISGFDSIQTQNWREGDQVEVEIEKNGEYLNFRLPNKQDLVSKNLEEMNGKMTKIMLGIQEILSKLSPPVKDDYPEFKGEPDFGEDKDVPFN